MIKIPVARRRRRLACFWLQMLPSRDAHQVHPEVKNISTSEYFHIHHVIIQPGVAGVVERTVHGTNLFPRRPHLPKMFLPPLPCLTTLALCNRIHSSYLEMNTLVLLYFYLTFTVDSTLANCIKCLCDIILGPECTLKGSEPRLQLQPHVQGQAGPLRQNVASDSYMCRSLRSLCYCQGRLGGPEAICSCPYLTFIYQ